MKAEPNSVSERRIGILSAIGAYLLWGVLPIYWKQIADVPANEILAHRVIWSLIFMVAILSLTGTIKTSIREFRQIKENPKRLAGVIMASLLISVNWLAYIWAVNDNRVVEASMGYYINPLVSVLLGILILKEKLSFWQVVSLCLAALGVLNIVVNFGAVPWISLFLAVTFGLYGLCKKLTKVSAYTAITVETLFVTPFALVYLLYVHSQGAGAFKIDFITTTAYLIGAGAVTAIPLLLFNSGANRLSLTIMGFIQYLSPSISLSIGVLLYQEAFTIVHMVSFGFIWAALAVFSLSRTKLFCEVEAWVNTLFGSGTRESRIG